MAEKKRQLRGQFTGGLEDVNEFYEDLKSRAEEAGWDASWFEVKPFGDVGPLNKLTFGFVKK